MHSRILAAAVMFLLGGCALSQSTDKVVLDYNRDFAKSRNEGLLLNVLRAAAREPLQFSTMGVVQGSIGNTSQLTIPFTNLIAGGKDVISPSLGFSDAINPSVTITPLASKDFAVGILRPIATETIQLFLHNGWDAQFLLPLIVGGVVCPDGRALLNSGEYLTGDGADPNPLHLEFKTFFLRFGAGFSVGSPVPRTFTLTEEKALDALKNGLGPNLTIIAIGPSTSSGSKVVTVLDNSNAAVNGPPEAIEALCNRTLQLDRQYQGFAAPLPASILGSFAISGSDPRRARGRIIFRSAGSVIQYLGESHRVRFKEGASDPRGLTYFNAAGADQILFRIGWGLDNEQKAVATRFHGTGFYIPRLDLRRGEGDDRTLKTLSFLDQLIALQTSESSIRGAQPVISVN